MFKYIAYKEWLKTRYAILILALIASSQIVYLFVKLARSLRVAGHEHIWDVVVNRDVFLMPSLKYLPLFVAIILALAQYIPEVLQNVLS